MTWFSYPETVNEKVGRVVATGTALLGAFSAATGARWPAVVLLAGFLLRVGWGPRFSPLALFAARVVAPLLGEPRFVIGAPKRFAQGVGAVFSLAACALFYGLGQPAAARALLAVLVLFASLEAGLGFCMGCFVYGQLQRVGMISPDVCVDCAPESSDER